MDRNNYHTYIAIQHASRKWLESSYGKNAWEELKFTDDEFQPMITLRKIMEQFESKATKNVPVDINAEINKLMTLYNPEAGMAAYVQGLKTVQKTQGYRGAANRHHAKVPRKKRNAKISKHTETDQQMGRRRR